MWRRCGLSPPFCFSHAQTIRQGYTPAAAAADGDDDGDDADGDDDDGDDDDDDDDDGDDDSDDGGNFGYMGMYSLTYWQTLLNAV